MSKQKNDGLGTAAKQTQARQPKALAHLRATTILAHDDHRVNNQFDTSPALSDGRHPDGLAAGIVSLSDTHQLIAQARRRYRAAIRAGDYTAAAKHARIRAALFEIHHAHTPMEAL